MEDNTKTTGSKILSALLIIYMIALVGSMFWFSQTEPKLVISSFGTLMVLLGLACLTGGKEERLSAASIIGSIVFCLGGSCMIAFPILLLYSPAFQSVDGGKLGAALVALLFMAIGLTFWFAVYTLTFYRLSRCTQDVQACATDYITHRRIRNSDTSVRGRRRRARSYIFTFTYNGQKYEVQDPIGTNIESCGEGELLWIKINPENPKEFYRKRPVTHTVLALIGAAAFGIGLVCLMVLI